MALALLFPLAVYIVLSGLDDLFVDLVWLTGWIRSRLSGECDIPIPTHAELARTFERRIAIFVPLWQEHAVIADMLAHNNAAIRYNNYVFFIGVYPNDEPTLNAVRECEARFPHVRVAVCPHDGPTSKADCLNWIYQRMLLTEEETNDRFDVIVTHDAEDLIHPESLRWMNFYARRYGFVQIPVLALPTPWTHWTHNVYCDEFAEFQMRDLTVRALMGGFIPSAGVGTAYAREALERLAARESNHIFDPSALTEDYENGFRLDSLGVPQAFIPVTRRGSFVATREYFPQTISMAIRQRTRWVTGIALQGWERHGWRGGIDRVYWFWRDRKGIFGSPISLVTNIIFLYGLGTRMWTRVEPPPRLESLLAVTIAFAVVRAAVRIGCVGRVYGFGFAMLAPLRAVYANIINTTSVVRAIVRFTRARIRHESLAWVKTGHSYPSRTALLAQHRRLGEILIAQGSITGEDLRRALQLDMPDKRLGERLVALGRLTEEELCRALATQQGLAVAGNEAWAAPPWVARALPAFVVRKWRVLPFKVAAGQLYVAVADAPGDPMRTALQDYTSLEIRFHLAPPAMFQRLLSRAVPPSES